MSHIETTEEVLDCAQRMQGFNAISRLRDIPWQSVSESEKEHWIALAKVALMKRIVADKMNQEAPNAQG